MKDVIFGFITTGLAFLTFVLGLHLFLPHRERFYAPSLEEKVDDALHYYQWFDDDLHGGHTVVTIFIHQNDAVSSKSSIPEIHKGLLRAKEFARVYELDVKRRREHELQQKRIYCTTVGPHSYEEFTMCHDIQTKKP